eukprot:585214-Pleurochrysis_carterae.AAC.1
MDIDIAVGGANHDVLRADVAARLLEWVEGGDGAPSQTAHAERAGGRAARATGVGGVPTQAQRTRRLLRRAWAGCGWGGHALVVREPSLLWQSGGLSMVGALRGAGTDLAAAGDCYREPTLARAGAEFVRFAQCALGADTRKYTTVACAWGMLTRLRELEMAQRTHGIRGQSAVAFRRDAGGVGEARAARAA